MSSWRSISRREQGASSSPFACGATAAASTRHPLGSGSSAAWGGGVSMPRSLEFILGLLERSSPAVVSAEDLDSDHAAALRLWQRLGFLAREPERHPVPS